MNRGTAHYVEYAIYYIIIFFILRQWLLPIMELTNTGRYELFLVFIALCLVSYLFRLPLVVSWLLKLAYIAAFIMHVYSGALAFSRDALIFLKDEIAYNISVLLQMEWAYVSDPFRSTLFFILIWMLVYLIHHWIHIRSTIFYFFILTVFFVGTLDTFTAYDGQRAIVEIVLLGLVMTAMLYVKRLVLRTDKVLEAKYYVAYLLPAVVLTLVFGALAYMLPKAPPQWPDPIPFIQNLSGKGGGAGGSGSVASVGYSEDDSVLGGPFSANDQLVFTVQAKTKQYWRIETREVYTSKGWETYDNALLNSFKFGDDVLFSTNTGSLEQLEEAVITPEADYSFLLYPYGTTRFISMANPTTQLLQNTITEKVSVADNTSIARYTVTYSEPEYSYTALKESGPIVGQFDPVYLQLPDTLPQRVRDLAIDITANYSSQYDKARAIQSYFGRSGFKYETQNVPIPSDNQDYVDQFLFETKYGYCDNFSTAMVVMLRAIDIPARWVKGFTGGTEVRSDTEGMRQFEITNNNAHSWVEAYIEGVGWMPFEPTLGYSTPADIDYDLVADETTDPQLLEQQEQERIEQEQQLQEETPPTPDTAASPTVNFTIPWKLLGILALMIAVVAFILYRYRVKWLPKVYVKLQKNAAMDDSSFEKAYERLLKQLAAVGLRRAEGQTLQAYAKVVDSYYDTTHMRRLTEAYERVIYSRNTEEVDFAEMKESWEYLINRTTG